MVNIIDTPYTPGLIEVYCGPVKCGKTGVLIYRVDRLAQTDFKHLAVKPSTDTRDGSFIHSRAYGLERRVPCELIDPQKPKEILELVNNHDLIIIDEAQFFDQGIKETVEELSRRKKNIVLGGLDTDFAKRSMGYMGELLTMAGHVSKITASCEYNGCHERAQWTQRLINKKPPHSDDPLVIIEGSSKDITYEARCTKHHELKPPKIIVTTK